MSEKLEICKYLLTAIKENKIDWDDDNWFVRLDNDSYLDISFCPFCGKELRIDLDEEEIKENARK